MRVLEELLNAGVKPQQVLVVTALYRQNLFEKMWQFGIPESHILLKPTRFSVISRLVKSISDRKLSK
jgi:hypothetical protein